MKNQNGVTLVSLVTTIIVMLIMAAVTTYSGIESYKDMKIENYVAKLKVVQEKVDLMVSEYQNWSGKTDSTTIINYLDSLGYTKLSEAAESDKSAFNSIIEGLDGANNNPLNYYIFTTSELKTELGLDGFEDSEMSLAVNFGTRYVIEKKGITIDEVTYHTQYDLPGGQKIQSNSMASITAYSYDINVKSYGLTSNVLFSNGKLTKDGQETKITSFEYKKSADTNWKKVDKAEGENYFFTVNESGIYDVRAYGDTNVKQVTVTLVNPPVLISGMTPVYWSGTTETTTTVDSGIWYDYSETAKRWANVKDSNGNYWVWIPRYAYSLDTSNKKINIHFLKELSKTGTDNAGLTTAYTIHPAFQKSSDGKFTNGEWNQEITGFWIAKFAASTGGASKPALALINGTTLTPAVPAGAHLAKASEHGAVLYLAYGIGNKNPSVNTTANAGGNSTVSGVNGNGNASSTGNASGVYDLNTTNGEMVAAKIVSTATANTETITNYLKSGTNLKGDGINDTTGGDGVLTSFISTNPYQVAITAMTDNQFIIRGKVNGTTNNMFNCTSGTSARYRSVLITK